jgi:hypothetical protein
MAAKLTRLTHKIAMQLHVVAESCAICSSRSRRSVRKLLDTYSYVADSADIKDGRRTEFETAYTMKITDFIYS